MNETEFRDFIRDIAAVAQKATLLTPTTVDDKIVTMIFTAVDSELVWPWVWEVVDGLVADPPLTKGTAGLVTAADKAAIDPATLLAIVTAIVELWKMFRKK